MQQSVTAFQCLTAASKQIDTPSYFVLLIKLENRFLNRLGFNRNINQLKLIGQLSNDFRSVNLLRINAEDDPFRRSRKHGCMCDFDWVFIFAEISGDRFLGTKFSS